MAELSRKGAPSVMGGSRSSAPLAPRKTMAQNAKVGSGAPMSPQSSGKMASVSSHVKLGTHRGKHSVAHAVNGKSGSGSIADC
jgi:hypothetical protein